MRTASRRSRRLHALVLLTGLALVAVVIGGIAWAAIPQNGVYTGCFHKSNGNLRVIDASETCKPNEKRITWNQEGQKGEPGSGVAGYYGTTSQEVRLQWNDGSTQPPIIASVTDLPSGDYFATATVQITNKSHLLDALEAPVVCNVGGGNAYSIDVPGHEEPGNVRTVISVMGGSSFSGVPNTLGLSCHLSGKAPAAANDGVWVTGTIGAMALSSLSGPAPWTGP